MFNAEVRANCAAHLNIDGLLANYTRYVPFAFDAKEGFIIRGTDHFSVNPDFVIACPLIKYELLNQVANATTNLTCVTIDETTGNLNYTGVYCEQYNIQIMISSLSGYSATSDYFNVFLVPNCTPHLHNYELDSDYVREFSTSGALRANKIIFSSMFYSDNPLICPITYFKLK
jgi:hypothetical protein